MNPLAVIALAERGVELVKRLAPVAERIARLFGGRPAEPAHPKTWQDVQRDNAASHVPEAHKVCDVPPAGWTCSRGKGHAGPCAARRRR